MLKIRDVTFTYVGESAGDEIDVADLGSPVLNDVSLDVEPGTCTLLVGPSGSGKTSLSRLCNGLIPQYYPGVLEGDILWKGSNMVQMSLPDISRNIGSVFQNPRSQFFCTDTTNEIAFACENFCIPRDEMIKRVSAACDSFNLTGLLGRNIFQLSGGEKQRIACASVWAYAPDFYVFDEPSSNLDLEAILRLRDIMGALKRQGVTLVVAEHRIFYLMDIIDSVCIVKDGRIVRRCSSEEFASFSFDQRTALGMRVQSLEETERLLPTKASERNQEEQPGRELSIRELDVRLSGSSPFPPRILDIPELDLPFGRVIALIGPNGAGKTTLAQTIVGLQHARNGRFETDGVTLSKKKRSENGYLVMQDVETQLFTDSVFNEIALSLEKNARFHGDEESIKERIMKLLGELDLTELVDRHPLSLSGGQKQRVVIASAIASGSTIVLFDEPTSGLDFLHMTQAAKMIKGMVNPDRMIMVITHDIEFIACCCTDVVELEDGAVRNQYVVDEAGLKRAAKMLGGSLSA